MKPSCSALVLAGGLAIGCTSGTSSDDSSTVDASPSTPKQVCEAYLQCLSDIASPGAGAAVVLYGDASPCWKGSAADAEACGAACRTHIDSRLECGPAINGRYAAICDADAGIPSSRILFDAQLSLAPSKGGTLLLDVLAHGQTTLDEAAPIAILPELTLTPARDGTGAYVDFEGSFSIPGAALESTETFLSDSRRLQLSEIRSATGGVCASFLIEACIPDRCSGMGSGSQNIYGSGRCLFFPLGGTDPIPNPSPSDVRSCAFATN